MSTLEEAAAPSNNNNEGGHVVTTTTAMDKLGDNQPVIPSIVQGASSNESVHEAAAVSGSCDSRDAHAIPRAEGAMTPLPIATTGPVQPALRLSEDIDGAEDREKPAPFDGLDVKDGSRGTEAAPAAAEEEVAHESDRQTGTVNAERNKTALLKELLHKASDMLSVSSLYNHAVQCTVDTSNCLQDSCCIIWEKSRGLSDRCFLSDQMRVLVVASGEYGC